MFVQGKLKCSSSRSISSNSDLFLTKFTMIDFSANCKSKNIVFTNQFISSYYFVKGVDVLVFFSLQGKLYS